MPDIPVDVFHAIRDHFFDKSGEPRPFTLRPKRNTQDDPFDEDLANEVLSSLAGLDCHKAPGPLVTPDIVMIRPDLAASAPRATIADATTAVLGLEVKKLERTAQGSVARSSGLDYNTTPPCGHMQVYDRDGAPVKIRGFYLFVCVEVDREGQSYVTAAALVDGSLLNDDYDFYLSIVGEREKRIGLGTYGDGADRARPMLIFSNPLGVPQLDRAATLVHCDAGLEGPRLRHAYTVERTSKEAVSETRRFFGYRDALDLPEAHEIEVLKDPFRVPARETKTRPRGRFRVPLKLT